MKINKIGKILIASGLLSLSAISYATVDSSISDTAITAQVKAKIAMNKSLSLFELRVHTNHQVVYLLGKLDSTTQASSLVEIAESTDGVKDVNTSNLVIKESDQPLTDSYITAKVIGKLMQEKIIGDGGVPLESITVATNEGVVYLKGKTSSEDNAMNAIQIAKSVSGVKEVKSDIKVSANS